MFFIEPRVLKGKIYHCLFLVFFGCCQPKKLKGKFCRKLTRTHKMPKASVGTSSKKKESKGFK